MTNDKCHQEMCNAHVKVCVQLWTIPVLSRLTVLFWRVSALGLRNLFKCLGDVIECRVEQECSVTAGSITVQSGRGTSMQGQAAGGKQVRDRIKDEHGLITHVRELKMFFRLVQRKNVFNPPAGFLTTSRELFASPLITPHSGHY